MVLPYNTLLHGPTRDAVGVTLRGNVVIVDEAHNLLDTISSVYSVRISGSHVSVDQVGVHQGVFISVLRSSFTPDAGVFR